MKSPYKSFIAYKTNLDLPTLVLNHTDLTDAHESVFDGHVHQDPVGGQWRNLGLVKPVEGAGFLVPLSNDSGFLMQVQFNERILPASVRDDKVKKKVAEVTEQQGRKVSKKQFRELRDDIEGMLLPQSHIRRNKVPILFTDDGTMFICTSSPTKADSILAVLFNAWNEVVADFRCHLIIPANNVVSEMTRMATDTELDTLQFEAVDSAILKATYSDDKRTIRVKDLSMGSHDVQELLKDNKYAVHEMMFDFYDGNGVLDQNILMQFKLNDKFIWKGTVVPDIHIEQVKRDDEAAELLSFSWLILTTYKKALDMMIEFMGGEQQSNSEEESTEEEEL